MNKSEPERPGEVLGRLLESKENAPALLHSSYLTLHNITLALGAGVGDDPRVTILVGLRGDDRLNAVLDQVVVDPVRSVAFVAGQLHGIGHCHVAVIEDFGPGEQVDQSLRSCVNAASREL